jgi:hypothetical protein
MAEKKNGVKKKGSPHLRVVSGGKRNVQLATIEKAYAKKLCALVDEIYERACDVLDWDWDDLAKAAQLSYMTVERLGNRITEWPRFYTVFKLAMAVGMEVKLQQMEAAHRADLKIAKAAVG